MNIVPAGAADRADIELLLDAAFGTGRHGRTAYRLREGVEPLADLSLVARDEDRLVGSIQYWPVELVCGLTGIAHPLTLLGPVAVAPDRQGGGLGRRLVRESLAIADARNHAAVLLIGDPDYYDPFGFSAAPTAGWSVPGPVERRRLLLRTGNEGVTLPTVGALRAPIIAGARATLAA